MRPPLISSSATCGLVLFSVLIGGCASEKTLQAQTQPLQDQIAQLEQKVATSGEASARVAQSQAENLATRQTELEKKLANVQAGIDVLQSQFQARDARSTQVAARLDALDASLTAQLSGIEKGLNAAADLAKKTAQQAANLHAKQEAEAVANRALDSRLNLVEQQLKTLSNLVQEALAASAKEIFLANGKEAFTVMLTEDKVLYPQNDPNLDPRDAAKLDELVDKLVKLDQEYHLDIQGHTANTSTDDNNYSLGKARAEVVKRYLYEKKGISISRMSTISYGANKPLSSAGGSNRRIFIRVLVLK
jgi:outer membrane protein OmpA-like peptidoglycan-associated protein